MMDAPSATDSDGLPYVFERFDLQGRMPPLSDALLAAASRGESLPLPAGPSGRTGTSFSWAGTS